VDLAAAEIQANSLEPANLPEPAAGLLLLFAGMDGAAAPIKSVAGSFLVRYDPTTVSLEAYPWRTIEPIHSHYSVIVFDRGVGESREGAGEVFRAGFAAGDL
jgi:hypothetical protein